MQIEMSLCRLHLASNPAISIRFGTRGRREDEILDGQVEEMAGGRLRGVSTETDRGNYPITAVQLTWEDVQTIKGWRGVDVMFRDIHGRKVYGQYFGTSVKDWRGGTYDVTFTLQRVSYEEAV